MTYYDFFNHPFELENIVNRDQIDIINLIGFSDLTEKEKKQVVLIKTSNDKQYLYLLEDLCATFKANNYCRLRHPSTNEDILDQIPPLKKTANDLEKQALNYNAYILDNNPEFIEILIEYSRILMDKENEHAYSDTPISNIGANQNEQLDVLYTKILTMDETKQELLKTLFVNNRNFFSYLLNPRGHRWILFPAKWNPSDINEKANYQHFKDNNTYKDFSHPNVLVGDLLTNPAESCLHSWGMDIAYLLIEYYLGKKENVTLFSDHPLPFVQALEKELKLRLANLSSSNIEQGSQIIPTIEKNIRNLLNAKGYKPSNLVPMQLLLEKIKELKQYSKLIDDLTKKDLIGKHVDDLKGMLKNFIADAAYLNTSQLNIEFRAFKQNFVTKVHSIDTEANTHRKPLKPIIINMLSCLSGVGFIWLLFRCKAEYRESRSNNRPFSFNKAGFFAKTRSQELNEQIEQVITKDTELSLS